MRIQKSSKYFGGCGSWEWGLRWPTLNNIIHRDIGKVWGSKNNIFLKKKVDGACLKVPNTS